MNGHRKIPRRKNQLCRQEALERLSRCGIEGKIVYLLDLIPLIELIWAGGQLQAETIDFLYHFIKQHVIHINRLAGYSVLSMADATKFAGRYLRARPKMALLRKLRECLVPVRLGEYRNAYGDMTARRVLSACQKILSISAAQYPNDLQDQYYPEVCSKFIEITQTLDSYYLQTKEHAMK